MRKILSSSLAACLMATGLFTFSTVAATPASASHTLGCKFASPAGRLEGRQLNLKWKDLTTRSGYSVPAQNAASAWTATPTVIVLTKVTAGANIDITDGNYGEFVNGVPTQNWIAVTWGTPCSTAGFWTQTRHIGINRYYTDAYPAAKRQSVIVHELGHALGLDHHESRFCTGVSIMAKSIATSYDSCKFTAPRQVDINTTNALYP